LIQFENKNPDTAGGNVAMII